MADNQSKQISEHKNVYNFSWFPSILLLFQLFLLLFELFKLDNAIVESFNKFLQESSFFISLINGLLIIWYCRQEAIINRSNISKEYKIINSCICVANIVLLNKLYDNNKINEIFSFVKAFFSSEKIVVCVFAFVMIVGIILIRYAQKDNNNALSGKMPFADSTNNIAATDNAQPEQTLTSKTDNAQSQQTLTSKTDNAQPQQTLTSKTQAPPKAKSSRESVLVFTIFMFLFLIIAVVVYLIIAKYDMVTNIINDGDESSNILNFLLLVTSAIALIILSIIIVAATARSIAKFILHIPEYIHRTEVSDDRIIKITVGIVLIPIFYGITKLFGISTDWVLNLLQNKNFLVVPFIMLLYFVLSMLFVEVFYGLFSGKPRNKWLNSFTEIVSNTGDSLLKISASIVKSFFRLLYFIPDFLESIQMVLMGEEDGSDNIQNKLNGQKNQGNNSN